MMRIEDRVKMSCRSKTHESIGEIIDTAQCDGETLYRVRWFRPDINSRYFGVVYEEQDLCPVVSDDRIPGMNPKFELGDRVFALPRLQHDNVVSADIRKNYAGTVVGRVVDGDFDGMIYKYVVKWDHKVFCFFHRDYKWIEAELIEAT